MGFFRKLIGDHRTDEEIAEHNKRKDELKEYIDKNYGPAVISGSADYSIYMSKSLQKIAICKDGYTFRDYDLNMIIGACVSVDDEIVYETSSGIGGAVVGAMLAGSLGAIAGFGIRPVKEKVQIHQIKVVIATNNPDLPEIYVPLLGQGVKYYSNDFTIKLIVHNCETFIQRLNELKQDQFLNK